MQFSSLSQRAAKWLLVAALFGAGLAMAQAEPTLNEVYATAHSGKLEEAQVMIQQVLIAHPKSAKAHFVRAELYARQGELDRARESLATADKLLPGLGFAKPEAVQALRTQLSGRSATRAQNGLASGAVTAAADTGLTRSAQYNRAQQAPSSSWGTPLLLAGIAIAAGYFIFRRRAPAPVPQAGSYGPQHGGLGGPQTFGMGAGGSAMPGGYPPAGGYPQQGGSGLGGRIMGGVATGLAVGAGIMAAEAIGRNLMGHHNNNADASPWNDGTRNDSNDTYQPIGNANPDMGGDDFGINDGGSWDSGGGSDGGGDWDN